MKERAIMSLIGLAIIIVLAFSFELTQAIPFIILAFCAGWLQGAAFVIKANQS